MQHDEGDRNVQADDEGHPGHKPREERDISARGPSLARDPDDDCKRHGERDVDETQGLAGETPVVWEMPVDEPSGVADYHSASTHWCLGRYGARHRSAFSERANRGQGATPETRTERRPGCSRSKP